MSDPRLVEPQRVSPGSTDESAVCAHRYWCWKRITAVVLLAALVAGGAGAVGVWWWTR